MKRLLATLALICAPLCSASVASATGFTDIGDDIRAHPDIAVSVSGFFRLRAEGLYNLDLDRGPTPSGQLLYPVPLSDPKGQWLAAADLRLRADVAFYAPFGALAVKARFDAPDNLVLGGSPDGIPSASGTQRAPASALRIKRVYAEVLTPIGLLAAGRMGSHWGLGMLTNGGDCSDCDSGDSTDRIAFMTPILGHVFAASFDFSSSGPFRPRKIETRAVDVDPTTAVRTVTFAMLSFRDELARERRRKAGKSTVEYGAFASHRWQMNDVPSDYLPVATPVPLAATQVMYRGYTATAIDAWMRITTPMLRIEAEAAVLFATVDQPSLIPGVLLRDPAKSRQIGVAVESEIGAPEDRFGAGVDLGYASGDPAPGFGVRQAINGTAPKKGDLDGAQANPPYDKRVDNFRFHPDYRVDRILFREIIGTVTDAFYVRPHFRIRIAKLGSSALTLQVAAIASFAVEAASAPGGKSPLGVEIDPTLAYGSRDGFSIALDHGTLIPLAGLNNVEQNLPAKPAQLLRVRAVYAF